MKKSLVFWLLAGLIAIGGVALALPKSPFYLPKYYGEDGRYYDGQPARHWIKALENPDADTRRQAVHALGAMGADASDTVPALVKILIEDPDRAPRIEAAMALGKMAPASRSAVPALAKALSDQEPWVRMNSAFALMKFRADARPAVPALIVAVQDEANRTNLNAFTCTIQEAAVVALGRASAGTPDAVPLLTDTLKGTGKLPRVAAEALGDVGPDARSAAPQLRTMRTTSDPDLKYAVEEALRKIEGEPAAP